uniref:Uncharacterized protein n=1 Tax=Amphimedon queenslandica TaxID=400682 RepID=A0A1X7TY20_AMPQE
MNDHEEKSLRTFEEHLILTGKVKDSTLQETFKTLPPAAPVPSQSRQHEPFSMAKVPAQRLPIAPKLSRSSQPLSPMEPKPKNESLQESMPPPLSPQIESLFQKPLQSTNNTSINLKPQETPLLSQYFSLQDQPPPIPPRRQSLSTVNAQPLSPQVKISAPHSPLPPRRQTTTLPLPPKPRRPTITVQPSPIASKPRQSQDSSSAPHDPTATVLQDKEGKKDPSSLEPMEGSMSPEYITIKEMLADLVDLLAGNAPVISRLNNHLFSLAVIPQDVHNAVANSYPTPNERATRLINSLLTIIQTHSNPNSVFSSLITALQKAGVKNMASKLMKKLGDKGGSIRVEQIEPPKAPKRSPMLTTEPPQLHSENVYEVPRIKSHLHDELCSSPTVIELSSKEEVARSIESLHEQFTGLATKIRTHFDELVSSGKLKASVVAFHAEEYLGQDLKSSSSEINMDNLKLSPPEINMDTIFTAIKPHYNFFNVGLLKSLVRCFIPSSDELQIELIQYIDSVDKFSESSQLKHIRSTIKGKLSSLPGGALPTTSNQTKPVVIKLNDRWDEMTLKNFKRVLQYYFEHKIADIFTIVDIDLGSVVITLLIPASLSQSIIDTINKKKKSMSRLGILEVAVEIPIRRKDDNNFDASLHQSVKAGDSFEVSMLLQLGADPNSKDERGKSAVEIANEGRYSNEGGNIIMTPNIGYGIY